MRHLFLSVLFLLSQASSVISQEAPLWMRYPAISPNGETIVFSYQGDLYTVPAIGGKASLLTLHEAHDYKPVWSNDGKQIAFASNRYGNYDVYIIPAEGGTPKRLTYYSTDDFPSDFTSDDKGIIFSSARLDATNNQMFPSGRMPELYQVPSTGGRVKQIMTTPAEDAIFNQEGSLIIFHDRKGYEDEFRKHHISSVTRDVWTYNTQTGDYKQLTSFRGEDRNPVLARNQQDIYYLSEQSGSFNIHKMNLENPAKTSQISKLNTHPVRHLSISESDVLCFDYNGVIYTMTEGYVPKKVNINLKIDQRYNAKKILDVKGGAQGMAVSPNGKEIAFVYRGEVFVTSVAGNTTKQITETPEQERNVSFSPDGRSLLYAAERNESWNLYQMTLARESEKYFFNSTELKEEAILTSKAETFQPEYSPNGEEVAFLEERTALKVINLKSKKVRLILSGDHNYSYSDGDQHYQWSPDSKWFLVNFLNNKQWIDQAGLVSADGKDDIINLTNSGYGDYSPRWMMDGKMMMWYSDRDGMKNHASWGSEIDIYGMFFTQDAFDQFTMSKEEYELEKEMKEAANKTANSDKKDDKKDKDVKEESKDLAFELENIKDRKLRLSVHSSQLGDSYISKNGETMYYMARFEKGFDLWQTDLKTRETKILAKLNSPSGGKIVADKEDKNLFLFTNGSFMKVSVQDGKQTPITINGKMVLDEAHEREYLFEHVWRQVVKKFYVKDLHGVDWPMYKEAYARFLPHINNGQDFAEMLSELLGELNASHTGARYWLQMENPDRTASLGLFYDERYEGKGLKITEIMAKSPVIQAGSKIKEGVIIEKIDGQNINENINYYPLLNRKEGVNTLLALFDGKDRWEETVKPISLGKEYELRYHRWVENCYKLVDEYSDGQIGYVHVRGMDNESFKAVYEEVLGRNLHKKALIVDTRFNGGGWLHDDLATFLSGKVYMSFLPRGQELGTEPQFKWTKPSCVVMSESNYSDAHLFPYTYKALEIGPLVGMPVPGTGTAVWWERMQNGIVFGIPEVGTVDLNGNLLENTELEPDVEVNNEPAVVIIGTDQQLQAAVQALLK